jgi:quercetin dioxygenase-like cupin family protein
MTAESRGIAVGPGEGETVRSPIGGDITIVLRGEQTNGALAVLENLIPPGEGPPLHLHTREDEMVYMLEGELRWKLGDEISTTGPGSFIFIPRGLRHSWQNVGKEPSRMLFSFAPAGMEGFFDRLSGLTDFDLEAFREAGAAHGMEVVGPPLAESDPL